MSEITPQEEKLPRKWPVKFLANDKEREEVKRRADAYRLSVASYLRFLALGDTLPDLNSAIQLTEDDRKQLAKVLAALGNISGNINQISRSLHRGRIPGAVHFEAALKDLVTLRSEVREIIKGPHIHDRSGELTG